MPSIALTNQDPQSVQPPLSNTISLYEEMIAYETLWGVEGETLKTISELFARHNVLPSKLLSILESERLIDVGSLREEVREFMRRFTGFSVSVHGSFQYPAQLRSARYPLELFYYKGDIGLAESRAVSVVGARKASAEGLRRARKLSSGLVKAGYTIVSGLATGIDTAAMTSAIESGGQTIGVIGTPLSESYPPENRSLQERVAQEHLLVSQIPFYRYYHEPFEARRRYFPERNVTMAALSQATVIVEASDTSGTLTQARACLAQGRKLFILNSCFENPSITWPAFYERQGATRVRELEDILAGLEADQANA